MIYAYIRFSTDKQDEKQQAHSLSEYAKSKGITIDKVVQDEGVSGGVSYKERNLYKLIQEMNAGDTLITSEISRLGRSMSDLNKLINDELKPRKIRLIVVTMGIDLDCSQIKALDEMLLFAFSFAAQLEKELIQNRTKNALESRKKSGKEIGGTNELWGKNTGSDRQEAIKKAAEASAKAKRERAKNNPENKALWHFFEDWQAIHGSIGYRNTDWQAMADKLNEREIKTRTGLPFDKGRVRALYVSLLKIYSL